MLEITFEQFASGDLEFDGLNLYVIKDAEVLYVGISRDNIWNRWFSGRNSHMLLFENGEPLGRSSIGQYISDCWPESRGWTVELYSLEDCKLLFQDDIERLGLVRDRLVISDIEAMMIKRIHPTMNVVYNTRPNYRQPDV